jgi:hypothetical protein
MFSSLYKITIGSILIIISGLNRKRLYFLYKEVIL